MVFDHHRLISPSILTGIDSDNDDEDSDSNDNNNNNSEGIGSSMDDEPLENLQQIVFGGNVMENDRNESSDDEGSVANDDYNIDPVNTNTNSIFKKKEKINYTVPDNTGTTVFFVFDVETTGPSRQYDKIIEIAFLAIRASNDNIVEGTIVGEFKRRIANGSTPIQQHAFQVHGISAEDLVGESDFSVVGPDIIGWISQQLTATDTGILVAHNGNSTDFQYFAIELMRHGLDLPEQIQFTLDTYYICQYRFPASLYKNIHPSDWGDQTDGGQNRMSVDAVCNYILRTTPNNIKLLADESTGLKLDFGEGSATFDSVAGVHHESYADTIGCAIILFGGMLKFWRNGLCTTYEYTKSKMRAKLTIHESVGRHWMEYQHGNTPPCGEISLPDFNPPDKLPPGPSAELKQHIGWNGTPPNDVRELLEKIFFFFFTITVLEHIVACTNAYAFQPWIKKSSTGRYSGKPRNAEEMVSSETKVKGWKPLSTAELIVFLGILILMGVADLKNTLHYWLDNVEDWTPPIPLIPESMMRNRFLEILANITFMMPTNESNPNDKLRKIRFVVEGLQERVLAAWNPEQRWVVDETMIRCCTKFCGFIQRMMCKPIKCGIKVWSLCFSKSRYLYKFEVYLGKATDGQRRNSYVYNLIMRLVPTSWDNSNSCGYVDNFFVTIPLFRDMRQRGIFMCGPTKHLRPKKEKDRTKDSHPFQSYEKGAAPYFGKGWMRHCYQGISNSANTVIGYLHVTIRLDNRFLNILSTVHISTSTAAQTVQRWCRSTFAREDVQAPESVREYQSNMGAVDFLNGVVALSRIRLTRCKKRYHRVIFLWLLAAVGFHNVKIIFEYLLGEERLKLLKRKHVTAFGYFHWLQMGLGARIVRRGIQMANDDVMNQSAEENDEQENNENLDPNVPRTPAKRKRNGNLIPHFVSTRCSPPFAESSNRSPTMSQHKFEFGEKINVYNSSRNLQRTLGRGYCKGCLRDVYWTIPTGLKQRTPILKSTGQRLPKINTGCSACKVILCGPCHSSEGRCWDHVTRSVPASLCFQASPVVS